MPDVELSLVHWPFGTSAGPVVVAKTAHPDMLRLVRDRVIQEARERAQLATRLNPSSAELSNEESRRVERTLRMLIPDNAGDDDSPHPGLRLMRAPTGEPGDTDGVT